MYEKGPEKRTVHFRFSSFFAMFASAADVPASLFSESENCLLDNDQHVNNTTDPLATDGPKPGELNGGLISYTENYGSVLHCFFSSG